jgi:hypothetical protein
VSGWEHWARTEEANAEISSLSCVSVSNKPVRTEPAAASAAEQSYAPTWIGSISVAYGNVAGQFVTGSAADQNARKAIRG